MIKIILWSRGQHMEDHGYLTHADGDVDTQIAVVGKELCYCGVKDKAVWVHDSWGHALVYGSGRGLPR